MDNTAKAQIFLSEISVSPEGIATLSCTVEKQADLSLILQDEQGRSHLSKNFSLTAGDNKLTFSISSFKSGAYKAWIDVLGNTYIRSLEIECQNPDSGILGKFKQWLNLF